MHPLLKCFSYSLYVDFHLLEAELEVNAAWIKALAKARLLKSSEAARLGRALKTVGRELRPKNPHAPLDQKLTARYEDIHTLIQARLEEKTGNLGKKIHTGRSRNDLVVTSTRVYLRAKLIEIEKNIAGLQQALVKTAGKYDRAILAGMTHLKKAQPVLLAHHLLAYVEMLEEDRDRLRDAQKRIDVLPLGSAAIGGSALPIDRVYLAKLLGFNKVSANSMAAVSDRAFLAEALAGVAILWAHLSRLSEDFILWNSEPFGFVELDDAFATGSSLMPQKKNPDVFELVRGRAGVIFGQLQALLVIQKGLPLAYNRDLQEDKPGVFDALNRTQLALQVLALTISTAVFRPQAMTESVQDDNLYATDLLEYLVKRGVSFSDAHTAVGQFVAYAAETGRPPREISLKEMRKFSPQFEAGVFDLFDAERSVAAKKTRGSTQPAMVRREIARWKKQLHA